MVDETVVRIQWRCTCQQDIPIRVARWVLEAARLEQLPMSAVVLTYKCRRCGIVAITVGHFVSPMRKAA